MILMILQKSWNQNTTGTWQICNIKKVRQAFKFAAASAEKQYRHTFWHGDVQLCKRRNTGRQLKHVTSQHFCWELITNHSVGDGWCNRLWFKSSGSSARFVFSHSVYRIQRLPVSHSRLSMHKAKLARNRRKMAKGLIWLQRKKTMHLRNETNLSTWYDHKKLWNFFIHL